MLNFIWNPTAGSGRARRFQQLIDARLKEQGVDHLFWETKGQGDAKQIARRLTAGGETDIIAVGGDGTINEVLNGLEDPSKVRLGIIPCGSGNDFAAAVGIPVDAEKALEIILRGGTKPTDYMICGGIRGLNIIGTGLDVDVLRRTNRARFLRGSLNYVVSLLISVTCFSLRPAKAFYNGSEHRFNSLIACACNGHRFGGGISICPKAAPADGKLDIVLVENLPKYRIPAALLALASGKILSRNFVTHSTDSSLKIDFDEPQTIQIDGELYDGLLFDVKLVAGGLHVYRS